MMSLTDKLADFLKIKGLKPRIAKSEDPEIEDDSIYLGDIIYIQVATNGGDYMGVVLEVGSFILFPERHSFEEIYQDVLKARKMAALTSEVLH